MYLTEDWQTSGVNNPYGTHGSFLDTRVFGYELGNVLVTLAIVIAVLLVLSLCWKYCMDMEQDSKTEEENKRLVTVREIRPGLLVIQGGGEDTLRILQEYDSLRSQEHHSAAPGYGSYERRYEAPHQTPITQASNESSSPPSAPGMHAGSDFHPQLVQLDTAERPPPYVPVYERRQ